MTNDRDERDAELLRRYFLGQLDEAAQAEIEERIVSEDRLFEMGEAVEVDLLDDYAGGGLSADERRQIERRLERTPRSRALLALTQDLGTLARAETAAPGSPSAGAPAVPASPAVLPFRRPLANPVLRYAMAAGLAGFLVLAGAARLGVGPFQGKTAGPPAAMAELLLSANDGRLRGTGGEVPVPAAPLSDGGLRIELSDLPAEYAVCDVTVRQGERTVFEQRVTAAAGTAAIEIPGGELDAGRYEIEVKGLSGNAGDEGSPEPPIRASFDLTDR
jgi:hypothetical protein